MSDWVIMGFFTLICVDFGSGKWLYFIDRAAAVTTLTRILYVKQSTTIYILVNSSPTDKLIIDAWKRPLSASIRALILLDFQSSNHLIQSQHFRGQKMIWIAIYIPFGFFTVPVYEKWKLFLFKLMLSARGWSEWIWCYQIVYGCCTKKKPNRNIKWNIFGIIYFTPLASSTWPEIEVHRVSAIKDNVLLPLAEKG